MEVSRSMVQEATKKETLRIAAGTGIGVAVMILVFAALHAAVPEQVPFNYTVVLGGLGGGAVAVLNFFLMGITVQHVAKETDDKRAYQRMKASYSQRILLQIIWIILAMTVPVFNAVAGIAPLLFPSLTVKIYYIFLQKKSGNEKPDSREAAEAERGDNK